MAEGKMSGEEFKLSGQAHVGRGATYNITGRFQRFAVAPYDDGWHQDDEQPVPLKTTVTPEVTRSILAANDSPDVPFERSINPYKGCEHGCIYCFARPSHAYLDLSPGLDFESRIFSKPNAATLLRQELGKPGYRCSVIALGANTDPYQPVERKLCITRSILEVLVELQHPVSVVTKSNMVVRDLDLLQALARHDRAMVFFSITTLDRKLARRMEPRAPTPERRLEAMRALSQGGVPVGVLAAPMIPALNDAELERILEAASAAGAISANYVLLRLPHEVRPLFLDWLKLHYPTLSSKVLNRLQQMRGGKLYDSTYGSRMRGEGPHAELLERRFELACRRLGFNRKRLALDCSGFVVPARARSQGRLFG